MAAAAVAAARRRRRPSRSVSLYDVGGRGDKSFNDLAAAGLEKAKTALNIQTKELSAVQGESDQQKADRLTLLANAGYNPIVAIGFAYAGSLAKVAPKFPKINFGIIDDDSSKLPNVEGLVFAENESSFLVGVAAAQATKTKTIGFIGGVQTPLIQKFQAGYAAGAKAVDPSIKVQVAYISQAPDFSGFNDPAKAKVIAEGLYDGGADVVYHAAGGSGSGLFQAAAAKKKLAIGVDSDQYQTATGRPEALHPDLGAQGRRHRGRELHQGRRRRQVQGRLDPVRPEGRRCRLRDVEPDPRPVQGQDRGVQGQDHRGDDHGPDGSVAPCGRESDRSRPTARGARYTVLPGSGHSRPCPIPPHQERAPSPSRPTPLKPSSRLPSRSSCTASPSGSPASSPTTTSTSRCSAATCTPSWARTVRASRR